jgi:hypothetical protein
MSPGLLVTQLGRYEPGMPPEASLFAFGEKILHTLSWAVRPQNSATLM